MSDLTPVMESEDRRHSQELSVRELKPPLRVPGYEQETFLGRGAFGEVWHAVDCNNGRQVVIKFFSRSGGLDWSLLSREVEKLRYLFTDRYVVQLFDVGWDANPPYYVMEYMEHGSLEDKLRNGPLPVDEALVLMREITVGLVHAHGKGIIHCDLKPGNILLDQDGKPRLADFGQSRLSNEQTAALGTLFYMAPEQADLNSVPDTRWDVYALGAILYRMLTGTPPHRGEPGSDRVLEPGPLEPRLECYRRLLESAPRPSAHRAIPGVDTSLAEIVDRCLEPDRKKRFPNVQALLSALEARETRRAQRPLLVLGGVGPALVVLVMAVIAGLLFQSILNSSERELIDRALESNHFAAASLAQRFALEVDRRWNILENEAADPSLRRLLEPSGTPRDQRDQLQRIQAWLHERHDFWNLRFSSRTEASHWYVLDQKGRMRSQSPADESLMGHPFGYRDYFHGLGHDLMPDAPPPPPIRRAHRSIVYRDKVTNSAMGTLSVPVWSLDRTREEPIGVLAMDIDMGHFTEFHGTRNQFAVLIDLRPDTDSRRGLIIEHPYLDRFEARGAEPPRYYLPASLVARGARLGHSLLAEVERRNLSGTASTPARLGLQDEKVRRLPVYNDPIGGAYHGEWLAVMEPVLIARSRNELRDSGWVVLVQERHAETLRPLSDARTQIIFDAVLALALVALVVTGLWLFVILVLREGRSSRLLTAWRHWRGLPTIPGGPHSGGSSSTSPQSARYPNPSELPGAVSHGTPRAPETAHAEHAARIA